mgnify:FL=1
MALGVLLGGWMVLPGAAQDLTTELAFFLRDLRNMQTRATVTIDGATTFATSATYQGYIVLACTGAETLNTITGAVTGTRVYIENTDTDCTIADDDEAVAANAINLLGTLANDVGEAGKLIVLIYNGTYWTQLAEADNEGNFTVSPLDLGSAGVRVSGDGDGAVTFLGLGNGADEDLTLNLDDTANTAVWTTSTGVNIWNLSFDLRFTDNTYDIGANNSARPRDLYLSRYFNVNSRSTVTVDGATTFALDSSYHVLACTGVETINTITGAATGMILWLENTDTECTIADDDDPTAANAVDLTGTATNDVGAVKKVIGLIYNGTDWLQIFESDN